LRTALEKIEAPASTHALIEPALKIYFEPEEMAWQVYPDAIETLKHLHRQGYRLGLYSNATDDAFIQRLINRNGLRPWLSPTFSSAGLGWRKPKREPFDLIAQRWRLAPAELAVVGDSLSADILGAQNAGMHSILMTLPENPSNHQPDPIQPTTCVDRLSDLPTALAQLTLDRE
jgi:HAD superfamily hydrolase (TIGR01549 family)